MLKIIFLSSYGEYIVGGVFVIDAARLVRACVTEWADVEILQVSWLHIGHTEVLIGANDLRINNFSPLGIAVDFACYRLLLAI